MNQLRVKKIGKIVKKHHAFIIESLSYALSEIYKQGLYTFDRKKINLPPPTSTEELEKQVQAVMSAWTSDSKNRAPVIGDMTNSLQNLIYVFAKNIPHDELESIDGDVAARYSYEYIFMNMTLISKIMIAVMERAVAKIHINNEVS